MPYKVTQRTDAGRFVFSKTYRFQLVAIIVAWVNAGTGISANYVTTVERVD